MALTEIIIDDTTTTLTVAALSTDTSFTVAAVPASLTATTQTRIRVGNEFCLVTYGSATVLTCVGGIAGRGIEGSTAASHANSSEVDFVFTAGGLTALTQASVNLSGALLATKSYNTSTTYTTSSTTFANIDATNLVVTFTAPASGNALVRLQAVNNADGSSDQIWQLASGGTLVGTPLRATGSAANTRVSCDFLLTGLTGGTAYTLTWQWATDVGGHTQNLYVGTNVGPAIMEVYDATLASNGALAVTAAMNSDEAQASIISANAASDHFFGSTLAAKWTLENATTPVATVSNSAAAVSSASGSTHMSTAYVPGASTALRVEARIQLRPNTTNGCGLLIKDTATTEATTNGVLCVIDGSGVTFYNIVAGAFTAVGGSAFVPYGGVGGLAGWNYVRLSRDASNVWTAYYSRDRIAWVVVGATVTNATTIAKAAFRADPIGGSVDFIDVVDGTTAAQTGLVTAIPAGVAGQALVVSSSGVPVWGNSAPSKGYATRSYARTNFI